MTVSAPSSSRRGFLNAFRSDDVSSNCLRPPWTNEIRIAASCTRCDDCITGCPEGVLVKGDGGFPGFDPHAGNGECTFCGVCVQACEENVFDQSWSKPWSVIALVSEQICLAEKGVHCEACRDICDTRAIRMEYRIGGPPKPLIGEDNCTGCGACVGVCPVAAIAVTHASSKGMTA